MSDHLTFELICDLADNALAPEREASARVHIAECAECADRLTALESLGAQAAALPREFDAPAGLWDDIQAEIATGGVVHDIRPARATPGRSWLVAAAIIIAIVSSSLTLLVTRDGQERHVVIQAPVTPAVRSPLLPARLASAEQGYELSVSALQRSLEQRRDSLAPSTIAIVERSLRVADSAIAEAREALAHDPANLAIARLFASNYERKIDLLKRATELSPRT